MPPRQIRPRNEPLSTDDAGAELKGGKRKAVSSACIPCRKRKSKCDGNVPSCSTCIAVYRTECCYDADSDHRRKGALKRDIQSLQHQNDSMDVIIASLRSLPEADAVSLLQNLRGGADPDVLADSLRSNVRLPHSYAPQTLEADFAQEITTPSSAAFEISPFHPSSISRTGSGDSELSFHSGTTSAPTERRTSWFSHPQDPEMINHLLSLYSCWVYPFHGFVCWDLFTNDMAHGKGNYCSSLLVNAILALGCHYSDRPAARTDPSNPATAGDQFFAEAKRLLEEVDRPSLTTVQALGIMGMREGSVGRDSQAYQLIGRCVRMALEMGLHLSSLRQGMPEVEIEARKITFWAVFNIETICAVNLGRLSQLPRNAADIETPSLSARSESQTWKPYIDANLSTSASAEQPSRVHLFKDQLSRLSELASDMVNTFYAPREIFTSQRLAAMYAQYQAWYRNLPEAFHLENTTLPHVIVLHMYYHTCVLHLFRPYIKLDLRVANLYPHDTCTFCANEISALMGAMRAMYGLRRVSQPTAALLLSASTIHLLNLPSEGAASNLCQGLLDLEAMSVNHCFAARAIEIIRSLASKWNIALPEGAAAVANYRLNGPGIEGVSQHSPPQTSFFAATIWRKQSSEGKKSSHSAQSRSSQPKDSPFSPPPHQKPQQSTSALATEPIFYDDPAAPLDPHHAHFWTPFPTQTMPMMHPHDADMMDLGTQFDGQQQWHSMAHIQNDQDFLTRHPSAGQQGVHVQGGLQHGEDMATGSRAWNWE